MQNLLVYMYPCTFKFVTLYNTFVLYFITNAAVNIEPKFIGRFYCKAASYYSYLLALVIASCSSTLLKQKSWGPRLLCVHRYGVRVIAVYQFVQAQVFECSLN